jgi:galactonate dehydratase
MSKISDVITHCVDLDGNTESVSYQLVLVEILTEDGLSGIGEIGLTYGDGASGAIRLVGELARNHVIGSDSRNISDIWERIYRNSFWMQGGGPIIHGALSALDLALWDIKGKYFNVPVYELLGGAVRKQIRVYSNGWSRRLGSPEAHRERASQEADLGFTALKFDPFKYLVDGKRSALNGTISPSHHRLAVERVKAVREGAGDDVDILLEFHGNLMPLDALKACQSMAEFNPLFVEEPIDSSDSAVLAAFAARIDIPVAAGERIYTNSGFRSYLETNALSVIQPDPGLCGGISELIKIAASAQAYQVTVQPHNCAGPVMTAACLQIASVVANFQFQEIFPYFDDGRQQLVTEPFEQKIENGYLRLPEGPGLGVTIDRGYLAGRSSSLSVVS